MLSTYCVCDTTSTLFTAWGCVHCYPYICSLYFFFSLKMNNNIFLFDVALRLLHTPSFFQRGTLDLQIGYALCTVW